MVSFQKKQSYFQRLFKPLLFGGIMTYLVFHALNGNHGVYALLKERHRLAAQEQELAGLKQKRHSAEHHVALLSDKSLDLDMLDERSRTVLGYAGKDEMVLMPSRR